MKTKNITINFRVRPNNAEALLDFIDEYQDGNEDLIALHVADMETGKMEAVYDNGEKEVKAYFNDPLLCEGLMAYSLESIKEGRGIYICYPDIQDISREANSIRVNLLVEMPWYTEQVPAEPEHPQLDYTPSEHLPQTVHYGSKITGLKHCMDENDYEKFESRVTNCEEIRLIPEPENPYDKNAIKAYTADGQQAGYIVREDTGMVRKLMEMPEFKATLYYMDFMAGSARIEITVETSCSLGAMKLFSKYTPIEVCRANYLFRRWGGIPEKEENGIFAKDTLRLDFDKFNSLDIVYQDRLAGFWEERMEKATVENPDFPNARMNVPLDLSVYGISWETIDLRNTNLLDLIEAENKMLAIYIRARRKGIQMSPEEFNEEVTGGELSETVLKRMHDVYDNNRL